MATCEHLEATTDHQPNSDVCDDCVREGLHWVALRSCVECGNVGCCDSSPGLHATAHFKASHHPVMKSIMPGDTWRWCYVDEVTG